jgi:hypothetical protein
MIFFEPDDAYKKEEELIERRRREFVAEAMKNLLQAAEDRKNGRYKSFGHFLDEYFYSDMGVEDQMEYDEKRRRRKLFEDLSKQQGPA